MDWKRFFELALNGFELAGVAVLVIGSLIVGITSAQAWLFQRSAPRGNNAVYIALRQNLGRTILLGLELLVIADIINSVAIETTFQSVAALGLLVIIRTFLSWSLEVEIEGQWPWKRASRGNVT